MKIILLYKGHSFHHSSLYYYIVYKYSYKFSYLHSNGAIFSG